MVHEKRWETTRNHRDLKQPMTLNYMDMMENTLAFSIWQLLTKKIKRRSI